MSKKMLSKWQVEGQRSVCTYLYLKVTYFLSLWYKVKTWRNCVKKLSADGKRFLRDRSNRLQSLFYRLGRVLKPSYDNTIDVDSAHNELRAPKPWEFLSYNYDTALEWHAGLFILRSVLILNFNSFYQFNERVPFLIINSCIRFSNGQFFLNSWLF